MYFFVTFELDTWPRDLNIDIVAKVLDLVRVHLF